MNATSLNSYIESLYKKALRNFDANEKKTRQEVVGEAIRKVNNIYNNE